MAKQFPRGSEWRKWDLHVHTPESVLYNQYTCDFETYFKELVNRALINNVSAIGVTDYFSIEGFKKISTYLNDAQKLAEIFDGDETILAKISDLFFLPNIELRILPVTERKKAINLHVLFNPSESIMRCLEADFLGNLKFTYKEDSYPCTKEGLIRLGESFSDAEVDDIKAYKIGVEQFKCTIDDIRAILKDNKSLKDHCLIAVSNSSKDGNSGIQHSNLAATREEIYRFSDMIFSANPADPKHFLGQGVDEEEVIIRKYRTLKPCIHGSDAHSIDELFTPDLNRYTWIKADTTFEGLKQTLYEPELRVKIQETRPSETEAYTKINFTSITLLDDTEIRDESGNKAKFCFSGEHEMALSNNLTCLIGGRGTGKSTLAHIICNKSNQSSKLGAEIETPLTKVCISPSPLPVISELTACDVPDNTEFFFQNAIEKYASNINEMSKLITHRLINLSAIDGKGLSELTEEWKEWKGNIQDIVEAYDKLEELSYNILKNIRETKTLRKQTEVVSSEGYKELQNDLKTLAQELSGLELYSQNYQETKKQTEQLKRTIDNLKWNEEQGSNVLDEFVETIGKFIEDLEAKHVTYIEEHKKEKIQGRVDGKKDELKVFLNEMGFEEENIEELATANQKIARLESQKIILEAEIEPYNEICKFKDEVLDNYIAKYRSYEERYREVCLLFKSKLEVLEVSNKKIGFDFDIGDAEMRNVIIEFIKDNLSEESGLRADTFAKYIFEDNSVGSYIGDINILKDYILNIDDTGKNIEFLKALFSKGSFVEKLRLRMIKSFYDIHNIRVATKYGGNVLKNTSFGERCGIVLAMVLSAGTNPIVIDQPEDHLGGRFISEILVPLIRKQKSSRQIILITRDANIVIGGDAELINILEMEDQLTKITPATIENLEQREKYIWELDGGKDAFLKRENKYNIKSGN